MSAVREEGEARALDAHDASTFECEHCGGVFDLEAQSAVEWVCKGCHKPKRKPGPRNGCPSCNWTKVSEGEPCCACQPSAWRR